MTLCLLPLTVARANTDSVAIYVGYFGTTYVEIADMTKSEIEEELAGSMVEDVYSSIDNGGYTRYNLAYGVRLEDLLDYVGIAVDDIHEIYFHGTDDYYRGFDNLFEPRYYFPHLAAGYNRENPSESDVELITSNSWRVPTILAFEQSLARNEGADYDDEKYRAQLSEYDCLRIVFGQTTWDEISTSDSVRDVDSITVMLKGTPLIADDEVNLEWGASQQISYRVNSGFKALNEMIESGLKFTSDNPSVVRVDSDGTMHAVNAGTAHITIYYDDPDGGGTLSSDPITVRVGEKPEEQEPVPGDPGEDNPDEDNPDKDNPDEENPEEPDEPEEPEEPDDEEPDEEEPDADEPEDEKDIYPDTFGSDDGTGGEDSGAGLPSTEDSGINGDQTGSVESGETPDGGTTTGTSIMLPLWTDPAEQGSVNSEDTATALSTQLETIEEEKEQETVLMDTLGRIDLSSLPEEQREQIEELMEEARLDEETEEELLEEALLEVDAEETLTAEQMDMDSLSNVEGLDEGVYLAIGNVAGAGSVSGSGGKALEVEEWTNQETIILIISLAAMFAVGLIYRIVKFRKDTER